MARGRKQEPCEALAAEEQNRADGAFESAMEIATTPGHPGRDKLPWYQVTYQNAAENAAANTAQPGWG